MNLGKQVGKEEGEARPKVVSVQKPNKGTLYLIKDFSHVSSNLGRRKERMKE